MAHYFISRHIGAVQWFKQQGIEIKQYYPQCSDITIFKKDDVVYGNLPIHLVEILTKHCVRYFISGAGCAGTSQRKGAIRR
jgi:CRISPR-associated protein Csx16